MVNDTFVCGLVSEFIGFVVFAVFLNTFDR